MSPDRAELLARIVAFDIDGGAAALPFAARLARENGWGRAYAARVVAEYKRFVFLAATGAAPVCPSEDVDAAWHLHLTYTRSYWGRFCGEVLGRPLHHEPTRGGPAEGRKHLDMYAATLAAYRAAFGHDAPADVWPAAAERFGADLSRRAVNTARNWVVPKAPVRRAALVAAAGAAAVVLVPGCEGGLNPFALKNDDFLNLLLFALASAVVLGRLMRSALRTPDKEPGDEDRELDWEETAYLAGGAPRLLSAAVARLVGRGVAEVRDGGKVLGAAGGADVGGLSGVEAAVFRALPVTNTAAALKPVQHAAEAAFAERAARLEEQGMLLTPADKVRVWFRSLIPLALVLLCLATPRLVTGVAGGHNVGYLLGEMFVGGAFAAVLTLAGTLRLSNRGRAVLAAQKRRHDALRAGTRWESNGDAGMAVALFGTAVLAGTAIAELKSWYPRQTTEASSGGCGGGCGSGCGGGDGGGGGCGGGCGGGGD